MRVTPKPATRCSGRTSTDPRLQLRSDFGPSNIASVTSPSVAVIGSGVIGTSCGYYLAKAGWAVTIIDQGPPGGGCSHANCGFIAPSHILPLAEPGALGRALKALLARNSPLLIRPRADHFVIALIQSTAHKLRSSQRT